MTLTSRRCAANESFCISICGAGGLDAFVDKVVPELPRRGIFRHGHARKTLGENLGLPRPAHRFFSGR
ncbi:hypothetical protein DXT88_10800 [Herbaspirillum lusitanum]|nr:hypothetical protein [Herbaspirillum lusitanum]